MQGEQGGKGGLSRTHICFFRRLRGKFYLETNDAKPFGRHVSATSSYIPQPPIPYKMPVNASRQQNENENEKENVNVDEDEDENNMLSNNIEIALT